MTDIRHIIERIKENEDLARKFFQVEASILSILNFNDFFQVLLTEIKARFDIPHVWISLIDKSELMGLIRSTNALDQLDAMVNIVDRATFMEIIDPQGLPLLVNTDLRTYYKLFPSSRIFLVKSMAIIPLTLDGQIVGSLNQADFNAERFAPGMDDSLLEQLAVKVSLCLSNVTAHEKLRYLAYHDPLTGLLNRRVMETVLQREFSRTIRYTSVLSLVFVDLDDFKSINDRYGHDAGDALLKYVAEQMRELCRETDVLARFAGDEFVIILPETSKVRARDLMERLKAFFSKNPLKLRIKGQTVSIHASLSYGISSTEESGGKDSAGEGSAQTWETMLRMADDQLYVAKNLKTMPLPPRSEPESPLPAQQPLDPNVIYLSMKTAAVEETE